MGIFDGCLLASDIDGTLLADGVVPQANAEKIKFFMREGGMFSLATGRTPCAVGPILDVLGTVSPSVYGNGCMIYDFADNSFLFQEVLPNAAKDFVKDVLCEMGDVGIEIHSGTDIFVVRETQETIDHKNYENFKVKCIDYNDVLMYNWNKVICLLNEKEQILQIEEIASRYSLHSEFFRTTATIYGRVRYYFEQVSKSISKSAGLKRLCEIFNIKKGCFYTIGDYFNDLSMLEAADISACPYDSPREIIDAATITVKKAENGAVADFIDYLTKRKEAENGRTKEN